MARLTGGMALSAFALLACAGCGGGSGDGGTSPVIVSPTPSPSSPAPNPTPSPTTTSFGKLGQTEAQEFVVLAFAERGANGAWYYDIDPTSIDPDRVIGLRITAESRLAISIEGVGEGLLSPSGAMGVSPDGFVNYTGYSTVNGTVSLSALYDSAGTPLSNSGLGAWIGNFDPDEEFEYLIGVFVYGVPTPAGALPNTGKGIYTSNDTGPSPFTIDFANGAVTGSISLGDGAVGGTYTLTNVSITADRTGFRGRIFNQEKGTEGEIEGLFTGPLGDEILVRCVIPGNGSYLAHVWGAKRT